jgi:hypothetical protein
LHHLISLSLTWGYLEIIIFNNSPQPLQLSTPTAGIYRQLFFLCLEYTSCGHCNCITFIRIKLVQKCRSTLQLILQLQQFSVNTDYCEPLIVLMVLWLLQSTSSAGSLELLQLVLEGLSVAVVHLAPSSTSNTTNYRKLALQCSDLN